MEPEAIVWIGAIALSVIGFGILLHMAYIRATWLRAVGCVVGNVGEWSKSGDTQHDVYFAEISFEDRDGKKRVIKGDVGRGAPWPKGERIDILYKPANPQHALCMKLWQQLAFSGVFIAFAVACWAKILGFVE